MFLHNVKYYASKYTDDIIVFSQSWEEPFGVF